MTETEINEDEGVDCRGCRQRHYFQGFHVNNSCKFSENGRIVSVLCLIEGRVYDYKYPEDVIRVTGKVTLDILGIKILDLEERINTLEQKTSELPESHGISRLKDEIMRDFAELSGTNTSKRKVND